jgi:hypothetical protein
VARAGALGGDVGGVGIESGWRAYDGAQRPPEGTAAEGAMRGRRRRDEQARP